MILPRSRASAVHWPNASTTSCTDGLEPAQPADLGTHHRDTLFVAVLYFPEEWLTSHQANVISMWIFIAAAVTDWFDGYLARKWNQTSAFGAFLDPVADKLMVAAALIVLTELGRVHAVVALIIIGREITISALREWMAHIGQSKSVAVSMLGKVKTVSQLVAIPFLLYDGTLFGMHRLPRHRAVAGVAGRGTDAAFDGHLPEGGHCLDASRAAGQGAGLKEVPDFAIICGCITRQ